MFRFAVSKMWVRQCMLYARRVVCARTILLGARGVSHVFLRDLEHGKATIQFGLVLHALINDRWVGTLTEENGILGFQYTETWCNHATGFPIGTALPLNGTLQRDGSTHRSMQWFFDNLLPEMRIPATPVLKSCIALLMRSQCTVGHWQAHNIHSHQRHRMEMKTVPAAISVVRKATSLSHK